MQKVLGFLGFTELFISGMFLLHTYMPSWVAFLPDALFVPIIISIVLLGYGFMRFNRLMGIISFIIGGLALLSDINIISFRIVPLFLMPWVSFAFGIRSLIYGMMQKEPVQSED
jgi:hypothetical protein